MAPGAWQEANNRYLATALAWLRSRLERRARQLQSAQPAVEPESAPVAAAESAETSRPLLRRLWRSESADARMPREPSRPLLSQRPEGPRGETLSSAEAEYAASAGELDPTPVLVQLGQLLGLSQFEREVLLLCAAVELDTRVAPLCALAQGDPGRPYPTFALALTLFDEPAWEALSPEHPLRYWRLIEIAQGSAQALTTSPLRADERIVNCIKGLNYLDDRLSPLVAPIETAVDADALPGSCRTALDSVLGLAQSGRTGSQAPVIQLLGADAPSKALLAASAARALGLRLFRLPGSLLPTDPHELETLARLWERESLLFPMALYLDLMNPELEATQAAASSAVSRVLARTRVPTFVDSRDAWPGLAPGTHTIDVSKPTALEQEATWATALGEAAGTIPAQLAGQFNLGLEEILEVARQSLHTTSATQVKPATATLQERLWDICLARTRPQLDTLAQRLQPKAGWDDLVLPATETALLHQIADQVASRSQVYRAWGFDAGMSRGFGISALFAGDSGTGKTMAAEVIAQALRLNLYRIDLSAVVSKYIGETEKNLRRLFDRAENGGAILFFDEADALFGKRSEVKDSHDRYANIEVNYLLQRMEAYGGLAILATNMKSALDQAFLRRLRFVVNFPFPAAAQRKALWERAFPPKTPVGKLDFDALSRLNLTGGNIHSIALNAAFLAAGSGGSVTQALLLEAARTELRKLGRVVNEIELRRQGRGGEA